MIIEIVLGILVITESYIIWNLTLKQTLETWMESFSNSVYQIQSDLKDIDSRGHFEIDDEVGSIFSQIKDTQETLNQYIEEPKYPRKCKKKNKRMYFTQTTENFTYPLQQGR